MSKYRRIRTVVISIDPVDDGPGRLERGAARPRFRPSDLLPWSDPYIAGLVHKLQAEVRAGRQVQAYNEAEVPWGEPFDEQGAEDGGFSIDTDALVRQADRSASTTGRNSAVR